MRAHLLASLCSDKKNEKGPRKQEVLQGNYHGEQNPTGPACTALVVLRQLCPNLLDLPFTSFSANRLVAGTLLKKMYH